MFRKRKRNEYEVSFDRTSGATRPTTTSTNEVTTTTKNSSTGVTGVDDKPYEKKARKKTSEVWNYMEDVVEKDGKKIVRCTICKSKFTRSETSSTSTLKRYVDKCKQPNGLSNQSQLEVRKEGSVSRITTFKYDHALMRQKVSHYILINELPFMHVESFMFNLMMNKATPYWQKISRATAKADCLTTYEIEKKKLKEEFKLVTRINITTDMWTSSNQKLGYMVVTAHWIDTNWKLNMRVLNICNVPPPHSGYVIADALFNCFVDWAIEDKIGTVIVDNAKANDVALKNLKENFSLRKKLSVDGKLFHVRCVAHILNLCVQDGLKPIESIVDSIRDGIKYLAGSEGLRAKFVEIVTQLHLKPKKLILDVSTRWNSTYNMLKCAIEFKKVVPRFVNFDGSFINYVPSAEEWEKVESVFEFLEVFNDVTKVVSGTEYPTSNLFLSEIRRVKQVLDKKTIDENSYIREMARVMKEKFDKYWGESNLLMSLGAVLDLRFKMALPNFCFPMLYPVEAEASRNLSLLHYVLNDLYGEYVAEDLKTQGMENQESSKAAASNDCNLLGDENEIPAGVSEYESFIHASGATIEPTKLELAEYLAEKIYIPSEGASKNFDALVWWKGNSAKYPILS